MQGIPSCCQLQGKQIPGPLSMTGQHRGDCFPAAYLYPLFPVKAGHLGPPVIRSLPVNHTVSVGFKNGMGGQLLQHPALLHLTHAHHLRRLPPPRGHDHPGQGGQFLLIPVIVPMLAPFRGKGIVRCQRIIRGMEQVLHIVPEDPQLSGGQHLLCPPAGWQQQHNQ